MKLDPRKTALFTALLAIGVVVSPLANAEMKSMLTSEKVNEQVSLINQGDIRIHTFHGVSNSHIIETANELRVIDAQMTFSEARALKTYISTLGKPLAQVILSHNHPDHWFGAEVFAEGAPIASISSVKSDLASGGMRYVKIMGKNPKMKGQIPDQVIVPSQEITLGAQTWDGLDVIVEEIPEQESHHSMLLKIPSMGVMIGQDLFYNNRFLVASERSRNTHWREILQNLIDIETQSDYKTLLVGHGQNGGPEILVEDIEYLDALEAALAKDLSQEETKQLLLAQFPGKQGKGFIDISLKNLFSAH